MTDITELAQRNELLIANGQQTADLLRHLADNEIDSDYFAVVSECESYGKETDAELSITEFALRAAGYVDALVEALEKAQQVPVMPLGLHPDTQKLVTDFCTALAEKLYKAQLKYGYDADWKQDGWPGRPCALSPAYRRTGYGRDAHRTGSPRTAPARRQTCRRRQFP